MHRDTLEGWTHAMNLGGAVSYGVMHLKQNSAGQYVSKGTEDCWAALRMPPSHTQLLRRTPAAGLLFGAGCVPDAPRGPC